MTMLKACVVCGRPGNGPRCPKHAIPPRPWSCNRAAAQIRANAIICHLCGKPFTSNDPPVADHVIPRAHGGADLLSNLKAAHRSCNGRKGQGRTW